MSSVPAHERGGARVERRRTAANPSTKHHAERQQQPDRQPGRRRRDRRRPAPPKTSAAIWSWKSSATIIGTNTITYWSERQRADPDDLARPAARTASPPPSTTSITRLLFSSATLYAIHCPYRMIAMKSAIDQHEPDCDAAAARRGRGSSAAARSGRRCRRRRSGGANSCGCWPSGIARPREPILDRDLGRGLADDLARARSIDPSFVAELEASGRRRPSPDRPRAGPRCRRR